MNSNLTLNHFRAPKGENVEPPSSSHPIHTSSYELRPGFIAMVREHPFAGLKMRIHTPIFMNLSNFALTIAGMNQETLKWKLFPFSLKGRAKQWYSLPIKSAEGRWEALRDNFF
jgi:hypothetical protein